MVILLLLLQRGTAGIRTFLSGEPDLPRRIDPSYADVLDGAVQRMDQDLLPVRGAGNARHQGASKTSPKSTGSGRKWQVFQTFLKHSFRAEPFVVMQSGVFS